ncbi:MAG: hypothetical protein EON85_10670 [Brevundimonas sp.]|nr:MAG: hypothetical protein EON85_10670 [Brevundimonas sp.]
MTPWSGALLALALTTPQAAADPAAGLLLDRARQIEAHGEALAQVWPGYWPADQPFVLYLPGTGAVFGGKASPEGPEFRPGPMEDVRFAYVLDYPSGVNDTVLLRLTAADEALPVLFHEQFHDYQSDAFRWRGVRGGEFVDVSAIPDLEAFTVAAEQERRLLHAALGPVTPEARRRLVYRYLAARERRLADLPAEVRDTENHMEWSEGTAEYAAVRAMTVTEPDGPSTAERLRERLDRPILNAWGSYVSDMFRGRAYGVGASLAWLLEDMGQPDWRGRIERGETLSGLVTEAAGERPVLPPEPVDEAVRDDVRRQMAARVAEPTDATDFLAREPDWLVIVFDGPARRDADMALNFSAGVMTPLPGGAIALQEVREVEAGFDGARVEARDRAVLILGMNGPSRRLTQTVYIALGKGERERIVPGQARITFDTLSLDLPPHATVEDIDGRRTIRVVRP